MGRKGQYLFKRKGSQNWWLRLQYTGRLKRVYGPKKEISLGTPDLLEAEILAIPHITSHKHLLFAEKKIKPLFDANPEFPQKREHNNGLHHDDGGCYFVAKNEMLDFYDKDGRFLRSEENPLVRTVPTFSLTAAEYRDIKPFIPTPKDDICSPKSIVESWIRGRGLNKRLEKEAKQVADKLQRIIGNRTLQQCTRDHAKQLVILLEETNQSSTVEKKIGHLRAAVNRAIDDGLLKNNVFNRLTYKKSQTVKREPLSDEDMQLVACNLHILRKEDQLLWMLLAYTGMRLSEPFQIKEEYSENGVRYVKVGTKTETSIRRVPLPTALLTLLPSRITTSIFSGDHVSAGKRISYFLRKLEISWDAHKKTGDKRKVLHCLRHRVKDKLRAAGCPQDIQYEILGHEKRTIASGYGHGYPADQLLRWIDQVKIT